MAKTRDKEQVRERILEEATRLFAENGYVGASTAQIVQAAGITKPMLYYYYGDKESLFRATIDRINLRRKEAVSKASASKEPAPARLVILFQSIFELARTNPLDSKLQFSAFYGPKVGTDSDHIAEGGQVLFLALMEIIVSGLENKELVGEPEQIAMTLMGVITLHLMANIAQPEENELTDELAQNAISLLLQGIGPSS